MKAYFYRIYSHDTKDDSLDKCLQVIYDNHFHGVEGHYHDCDGAGFRIAHFSRKSDYCTGDIVKQQKNDIPPQAPDGKPLKVNKTPLGHLTAFLYHYETKILIVQANRNGVSASSILRFIKHIHSHSGFEPFPVLSKAAIDELSSGNIRKFIVKFAAPEDLSVVEGQGSTLQNLDRMRRMFASPAIEVSFGFDTSKEGGLKNSVIRDFIHELGLSKLRTQKVKVKKDGASQMLDLLGEKLNYEESIKLGPLSIDDNYKERNAFVKRAYDAHKKYIKDFYKDLKNG